MDILIRTASMGMETIIDVAPILVVLLGFQFLVIRRRPPKMRKIAVGFLYVLVGLTLFLVGLEEALFPLGRAMAKQLIEASTVSTGLSSSGIDWMNYMWVYIFAAAIGYATTIAEPALIAVGLKAEQLSGGLIRSFGLRTAVAVGVAVGVSLGTFRIVSGGAIHYYITVAYGIVLIQTLWAPRNIIPLAYDLGGVTTSTVTVPVLAALGLGLASAIPGRSPLIDGFGLIAFASVFPIMAVMAYATLTSRFSRATDETERKDKL